MNSACVNPVRKPPRKKKENKELRIVLIGKTGAGKSATANALLKYNVFESRCSPKSITQKCQYERKKEFDKHILIVDTPGMFDTNMKKEVVNREIKKCVAISAPGPHAFLLVISLTNRFTAEEAAVIKELDAMFGENIMNYLIVVFTGRDQVDHSIDAHMADCPNELKQILANATGGYVTFNNRGDPKEREDDTRKLLERIDVLLKANGGGHFTSEMFREAEEIMKERIGRELKTKEDALRKEIEQELRVEMEEIMRKEREYFLKLHEANVEHLEKLKLELNTEKGMKPNKPPIATKPERILRELPGTRVDDPKEKMSVMELQQKHTEKGPNTVKIQGTPDVTDTGKTETARVEKRLSDAMDDDSEDETDKEKTLGKLAHCEMERIVKRNKIIEQIQKVEGAERVRAQHQMADIGEQIKQIVAQRKLVVEQVTEERFSKALPMKSQALREDERQKIEKEEQKTLGYFTKGIKTMGTRFLNLFR